MLQRDSQRWAILDGSKYSANRFDRRHADEQTNIDSTSATVYEQKKDTRAVQSKHLQLPIEDELPKIYGQNTVATLLLQKLSAVESVRKHMFT